MGHSDQGNLNIFRPGEAPSKDLVFLLVGEVCLTPGVVVCPELEFLGAKKDFSAEVALEAVDLAEVAVLERDLAATLTPAETALVMALRRIAAQE